MDDSQNRLQRIEDLITQLIGNVASQRKEMNDSALTLRKEMNESVSNLRNEMNESIADLRKEMADGLSNLRSDMYEQFKAVNLRLDYRRDRVDKLEEEFWIMKQQS